MKGTEHYGTLDVSDPVQVAEYEYHFYLAYAGLAENRLVRLIWDWDDAGQRVRTRIPYDDQVIYGWRDRAGRLVGAMAVNVRPDRAFQGEAFGFAPQVIPPELSGGRCCEILNVMTTCHHQEPVISSYHAFIRDFCYGDLVSRGFDVAYSTCTRRRLRPYVRLGAKLLRQSSIDGEDRFFLLWPICELVASAHALRPSSPHATWAAQ